MRIKLIRAATAAVCMLMGFGLAAPASADAIYTLSSYVGSGTPPAQPYGTITLHDNGSGGVLVTVTLASTSTETFVDTGAGDLLDFGLDKASITIGGLTAGTSLASTTSGSIHTGGGGNFDFAIDCGTACGNGGSAPHFEGPLSFTINNVAISDFVANSSGNFFAVDTCLNFTAANGCGLTGVTVANSVTTAVPEPNTMALLGFAALSLSGFAMRRRRKRKAA